MKLIVGCCEYTAYPIVYSQPLRLPLMTLLLCPWVKRSKVPSVIFFWSTQMLGPKSTESVMNSTGIHDDCVIVSTVIISRPKFEVIKRLKICSVEFINKATFFIQLVSSSHDGQLLKLQNCVSTSSHIQQVLELPRAVAGCS